MLLGKIHVALLTLLLSDIEVELPIGSWPHLNKSCNFLALLHSVSFFTSLPEVKFLCSFCLLCLYKMINNITFVYLEGWESRIFPWLLEKISESSYLDWSTASSAGCCWIWFKARCLTKRGPWQGIPKKPILDMTWVEYVYVCVLLYLHKIKHSRVMS